MANASATDGMYYDFNIPLGLKNLLDAQKARNPSDPNIPNVWTPPANRVWLSQPRISTDPTTEVITINFKMPSSISEVTWKILRCSCRVEYWYQDRQGNIRQMADQDGIPIVVNLSSSSAVSWYTHHAYTYPIVAKAMQIRITRVADPTMGNTPYCVGLQQGLPQRDVYTRTQGIQSMSDEQDSLGNVISKTIQDWDASDAVDDKPNTFWKSFPQPDPNAVVNMFLDIRDGSGNPQLCDKLYIDPVYTGSTLNLYYSNDDSVATRKLSPTALVPDTQENAKWTPEGNVSSQGGSNEGLLDSTTLDSQTSLYQFPFAVGPLVKQDAWIGISWAPNFAETSGPANNPVLFNVIPTNTTGSQYWPKVFYDVGAGEIKLEMYNGTTSFVYAAAVSPTFVANQQINIAAGWNYDSTNPAISIVATDNRGNTIANFTGTDPAFPTQITFDGDIEFTQWRGLILADIVKVESPTVSSASFLANPTVYVNPDPVLVAPNGLTPASTLDNAILAVDWTTQQFPSGGSHSTAYVDKEWTPIWANYITQKGYLNFPQAISAKYIKMEFTQLTPEPYPVYDQGIQTSYQVFPMSVIQSTTHTNPTLFGIIGGTLTLGLDMVLTGIGAVNWVNPASVNAALNGIFGTTTTNVQVTVGPGYAQDGSAVPNAVQSGIIDTNRQEISSPWVYRRTPLNIFTLAGAFLQAIFGQPPNQGNVPPSAPQQQLISDATTASPATPNVPAALPVQGQDWWVFPGQTLKMPANVISGLTESDVVTNRNTSTTTRVRFSTTAVHRYDTKTVTLDTAIAYFAGIREVQPYVTSYIAGEDPLQFKFDTYDKSQWTLTNINALSTGPITAKSNPYVVVNPTFDTDINNWTATGSWFWDDNQGHSPIGTTQPGLPFFYGAASIIGDSALNTLVSEPIPVNAGDEINFASWTVYQDVTSTAGAKIFMDVIGLTGSTVVDASLGLGSTAEIDNPTGSSTPTFGVNALQLYGSLTIPAGIDHIQIRLNVNTDITGGQVWFDDVAMQPTPGFINQSDGSVHGLAATAFKDVSTSSTFAKVNCVFNDSGTKLSDSMWAQADPFDTNISSTLLAYYTETIPTVIPSGSWGDTFARWSDLNIDWGTPLAEVAIQIDPNMVFDNKRVIHFFRAAGAEQAGIQVRQETNFVPNGLFRMGCVFFHQNKTNNTITLRLRRVSDGVEIYSETITNVPVGYWYTYLTKFVEIPDTQDQVYTVELTLDGDAADDLYLNNLWCEIAQIRYFVRLGGTGEFLHDVTPLAYADNCNVSTTTPVNEMSVQVEILSDRSFAYGCELTPVYLK